MGIMPTTEIAIFLVIVWIIHSYEIFILEPSNLRILIIAIVKDATRRRKRGLMIQALDQGKVDKFLLFNFLKLRGGRAKMGICPGHRWIRRKAKKAINPPPRLVKMLY